MRSAARTSMPISSSEREIAKARPEAYRHGVVEPWKIALRLPIRGTQFV
jgi:hypothetical protein